MLPWSIRSFCSIVPIANTIRSSSFANPNREGPCMHLSTRFEAAPSLTQIVRDFACNATLVNKIFLYPSFSLSLSLCFSLSFSLSPSFSLSFSLMHLPITTHKKEGHFANSYFASTSIVRMTWLVCARSYVLWALAVGRFLYVK